MVELVEILLGAVTFTAILVVLVLLVSAARRVLVPTGTVALRINDRAARTVPMGLRLHAVLGDLGVHLPSACGGRGTCGQCLVTVPCGGGPPLAVETTLLTRRERARGLRLACQVTVRDDLHVELPAEVLGVRKWTCTVRGARNVTTLLRELVLELPAGERLEFRAGSYVQVHCPPHHTRFADFPVDERHRADWHHLGLWPLEVSSEDATTRAYSLANPPGEDGSAMLLVRIAIPPPGAPDGTPPGVVSSFLFGLREGDPVEISGPFGTFHVQSGDREMVFIGGGAGMAPMRSMILDQLQRVQTRRTMSFWYGARNLGELLYREEFDRLDAQHEQFSWCPGLSEPRAEDQWEGATGFIHEILHERYLRDHPSPEECEYYLCGPPMMSQAVRGLLDQLGVDPERVHCDDFGG